MNESNNLKNPSHLIVRFEWNELLNMLTRIIVDKRFPYIIRQHEKNINLAYSLGRKELSKLVNVNEFQSELHKTSNDTNYDSNGVN